VLLFTCISFDILGEKWIRPNGRYREGRDPLILPCSTHVFQSNNVQILILDFTTPIQGATTPFFATLVRTLVEASRPGIDSIYLIVDAWIPRALQRIENQIPIRQARTSSIRALNEGLGMKARLDRVVSLDAQECWVWKGEGDRWSLETRGKDVLRWRPEGWFGVFGL
jgi:hypothetical protein